MASGESVSEAELRARLDGIVRASAILMQVLTTVRDFALPDWRIASGSVFQTVWNSLTGRDPDYGIHDYDVLYFDPDTSWDAEDAVIRRIAAAFSPGLSEKVEVRNQARVHLWFEQKFGEPYTPLGCTDEALGRFLSAANAVGIRLEPDGRIRHRRAPGPGRLLRPARPAQSAARPHAAELPQGRRWSESPLA
jgi:hypothetical protein